MSDQPPSDRVRRDLPPSEWAGGELPTTPATTTPASGPNIPASGELLVELPDGRVLRLGDVPEPYRDRHTPLPNEIVIRSDEDLQKILDEPLDTEEA